MIRSVTIAILISIGSITTSWGRGISQAAWLSRHLEPIEAAERDSLAPSRTLEGFRGAVQSWVRDRAPLAAWDSIEALYPTIDTLAIVEYTSPLGMLYCCCAILEVHDTVHFITYRYDSCCVPQMFADSGLPSDDGRSVKRTLAGLITRNFKSEFFKGVMWDAGQFFVFFGKKYGSLSAITDYPPPKSRNAESSCSDLIDFVFDQFRPLWESARKR
jgi:hypothetical protein